MSGWLVTWLVNAVVWYLGIILKTVPVLQSLRGLCQVTTASACQPSEHSAPSHPGAWM